MTKSELLLLKKCYELMLRMEQRSEIDGFNPNDLNQLADLLENFVKSEDAGLRSLALIHPHLHSEMSSRHFSNYLIPLERLLGRTATDSGFLVHNLDRSAEEIPMVKRAPLFFILENLRSAFNVGSIFRLADGLGAQEVILCGYTPTPENETLQKTALGSHHYQPWNHQAHLDLALDHARNQNRESNRPLQVVALETAEGSRSLYDFQFQGPTVFLVGNERYGLEASTLKKCDHVLHIPMFGIKNSLNVVSALSMAASEWRRQYEQGRHS
ncbi:MAG: hypothetical protein COT73_10105 [Bdellovibrio sp. CG10_big_fil_rev_8_21_14_0_10_47_8]|nr:MAG: hypothetical protein COT73_10105 [Bdellovibrio sp. CG10_big_fil_rev_8_21_14_0_10_47_8]